MLPAVYAALSSVKFCFTWDDLLAFKMEACPRDRENYEVRVARGGTLIP